MSTFFVRRIGWFAMFWLVLGTAMTAQEAPKTKTITVEEETAEQEARKKEEKEKAEAARSSATLVTRMFSPLRNDVSFSLRFSETYDSNIFTTNTFKHADYITSIRPRLYGTFQKDRFQFRLDYIAGYDVFGRFSKLNKGSQLGGVGIRYQASPHVVVTLSDRVSLSNQNTVTLGTEPLSLPGLPGPFSQNAFFSRQRLFLNVIGVGVDYQVGMNTFLRFTGDYSVQRFRENPLNNINTVSAGMGVEHKITRRVALTNDYSFTYAKFNNDFRQTKNHRIESGLRYFIRPTFSVFASGGLELREIRGVNRGGWTFRGGMTKSTSSTSLGITYTRSSTSGFGLPTTVLDNAVSVGFGRQLVPRLRLGSGMGYSRSQLLTGGSRPLSIFYASSSLEYAMRYDLTFYAAYSYLHQQAGNFDFAAPSILRNVISVGFEYRLPSLRGR